MSEAPAPAFLEIAGLKKSFGPRAALAGISLDVAKGSCVAILGANGAGKTTLLRIVATLARPSGGSVRLAGMDLAGHAAEARRRIGFLSHRTLLYDDLTAEQNLAFYGRVYGLDGVAERSRELLARVGLSARRDEPVRRFSRGMQQRLALARALLHAPDLLLLDEPDTGLDLPARLGLTKMLGELVGSGVTVLLSTHDLDTAFALAGRMVALARGRVAGDWPAAALERRQFAGTYLELVS